MEVAPAWQYAKRQSNGHTLHVLTRPDLDTEQMQLLTPARMVWHGAEKDTSKTVEFEETVSEGEYELIARLRRVKVADLMIMTACEMVLLGAAVDHEELGYEL